MGVAVIEHLFEFVYQSAHRFRERYPLPDDLALGYRVTDRTGAPDGIRQSREFSELCPMSAVLMVKSLSP